MGCGQWAEIVYISNSKGLNVTAIDASDGAIEMLKAQYQEDNICFICDDFVCSSAIFSGQYDYCYSRFSLHAINEKQETEVYCQCISSTKGGRGVFLLKVRSVKDELFRVKVKKWHIIHLFMMVILEDLL